MSRFEEQFKNSFDHFKPEVDPKLWQNISQQLPGTPQAPTAGASAGKGILAQLGIKGIAAVITAATLAILGINYLINKDENTVQVQAPVIQQETSISEDKMTEEQAEINRPSENSNEEKSSNASINPSTGNSENKIAVKSNTTDSKTNIEKTLTGIINQEKGESEMKDSPTPTASDKKTVAVPTKSNPNTVAQAVNEEPIVKTNPAAAPRPVLILSTKGGFAPLSVTALTNQEGAVNAIFDFGDGTSNSSGVTANTVYEEPGTYTVTCEVNGVKLEQKVSVFGQVPSAFSPNGDGINDVFVISKDAGITVEIRIFNRFGKMIYSNKGNTISWDGTFEGRFVDTGTYLYDIFATSDGGSTFKQKGTIHLFR